MMYTLFWMRDGVVGAIMCARNSRVVCRWQMQMRRQCNVMGQQSADYVIKLKFFTRHFWSNAFQLFAKLWKWCADRMENEKLMHFSILPSWRPSVSQSRCVDIKIHWTQWTRRVFISFGFCCRKYFSGILLWLILSNKSLASIRYHCNT